MQPVKVNTATTVFLAHRDIMMVACYLQVRSTVIVTGQMLPGSQRARQPMQPSQSGTLSSFSALMLLVGQQE